MLSIGNTTNDQKPSKVVEYMAMGKPILHICSIAGDPVRGDVAAYPLGCVIEAGEDSVRACETVRAFLERTRGEEMTFDEVEDLFRDENPEAAAERLLRCWRRESHHSRDLLQDGAPNVSNQRAQRSARFD